MKNARGLIFKRDIRMQQMALQKLKFCFKTRNPFDTGEGHRFDFDNFFNRILVYFLTWSSEVLFIVLSLMPLFDKVWGTLRTEHLLHLGPCRRFQQLQCFPNSLSRFRALLVTTVV